MIERWRGYRFPWRSGNRCELLVDGDRFYPRMLAAIQSARQFILFEQYLVESGEVARQFADAFVAAARRGVRVKLILDGYGSLGLLGPDRERLLGGGVELVFYNPVKFKRIYHSLFRDHRKVLVVDGETGFTGGAGITDDFDPRLLPEAFWHEVMVCARGPVVGDWVELFARTWEKCTGAPLDGLGEAGPVAGAGHHTAQLLTANVPTPQEVTRALVSRLRRAQQRAWIATPYFLPTWKVRRALWRAARRGADVRVLVPGPHSDHPWVSDASRRQYGRLLRHGVRVFEYQPRFIHSKVLLCDNWVSVGSSNLDRWNQRWNLDANLAVSDPDFTAEVEQLFKADFAECREVLREDWKRRPWGQKLREWLATRIVIWVEQFFRDSS